LIGIGLTVIGSGQKKNASGGPSGQNIGTFPGLIQSQNDERMKSHFYLTIMGKKICCVYLNFQSIENPQFKFITLNSIIVLLG